MGGHQGPEPAVSQTGEEGHLGEGEQRQEMADIWEDG